MKTYRIKKGRHFSTPLFGGITLKNKIAFECIFSENCLYTIDGDDKYDINKLYGFSTTWFHHKQSGRIGWRCLNGKDIEIVTYSYNKGSRDIDSMDILGVVKPNEKFRCVIEDCETHYHYELIKNIEINKTEKIYGRDKKSKDWFLFHYILKPYFGGNKKAPHDMNIKIKRIEI